MLHGIILLVLIQLFKNFLGIQVIPKKSRIFSKTIGVIWEDMRQGVNYYYGNAVFEAMFGKIKSILYFSIYKQVRILNLEVDCVICFVM